MIDAAKADRNNACVHLKLGFLSLRARRARRAVALRRRRLRIPVGHRPAAHLALRLVRHGAGRVRRRRLADLLRHRPQDHAGQGRAHPVRDGVRQVGRGGSRLRARPGRAGQHRASPAGQHQARRGARRAPAVGRDPGRAATPRSCSPAAGSSARWATATPPSPRSAATSSAARTGASASSRSPARCSCSAGSTACSPTTRARRRTTRPRWPATAPTSRPSPRDSVLREFDQPAGARRVAYLRQFWTDRDRAELRADGERLREHYRRLFYARKNFQLTALNRHYDIVERYRSGSRDFDDRGVIYIRHGEPTSRATYAAPGLEPNESWRYSRPDGDLHLPLRRPGGRAGLQAGREPVRRARLQQRRSRCGADRAGGQSGGRAAHAVARAAVADLPAAAVGRADRQRPVPGGGARGWGRRASRVGTTTDSYELRFPEELKVRTRGARRGPRLGRARLVQIAYAIAGSRPRAGDGDPRLSLLGPGALRRPRDRDGPGRGLARHHPALRRARRRCPTASTWSAAWPCRCRPGSYAVPARHPAGRGGGRRAAARHACGSGRPTSTALAPQRPGARQPQRPTSSGAAPDEDTVLFNPLRTFKRSEEMELYYEVEGLRPGSPYDGAARGAEAGWRAAGCSRRSSAAVGAALSLKFDAQAAAPLESAHSPEPPARAPQAGQLRAGGGGGRRRRDGRTSARRPSRWWRRK